MFIIYDRHIVVHVDHKRILAQEDYKFPLRQSLSHPEAECSMHKSNSLLAVVLLGMENIDVSCCKHAGIARPL